MLHRNSRPLGGKYFGTGLLAFLLLVADDLGASQCWIFHRQKTGDRENVKPEISEDLPESQQKSQNHPQRMERGLHVITEKFRITKDKTGAQVMIRIPYSQRDNWYEQPTFLYKRSKRGLLDSERR